MPTIDADNDEVDLAAAAHTADLDQNFYDFTTVSCTSGESGVKDPVGSAFAQQSLRKQRTLPLAQSCIVAILLHAAACSRDY